MSDRVTRPPAAATMRSRLVLAAFALLAVGAACSGGNGDAAGRLTVDGRAEVAEPGGKVDVERGSRSVQYGERVKVLEGTAVLRLSGGRVLELRAGTNVVLQEVKDGGGRAAQPLLLEKDLLVQAPSGTRLTVSTEGTDIVVSGGAQVSRGPVLVVSSYDGVVELRSGDQSATVAALREVRVPAGGALSEAPSPLSYSSDDAWDRRFLSDAIELGNELEARSKGFSAQLAPTEGHTVAFLERLLPSLAAQPEFGATLFDALRPPGESLIGAAIALEGTRGSFAERWTGIFGFRDDGAQWGLVALDQGVTRAPLLAAVDAAVGRGPQTFVPVPPPGGSGEVALPGPPAGGGSGTGGSGSGGTGGSGAAGTTPRGSTSVPVPTTVPSDSPRSPGPINTGIPVIDNTINALVDTLAGLLGALGGS